MPHILSQTVGVLAFDECATPRGEENLAMVSSIIKNCGIAMTRNFPLHFVAGCDIIRGVLGRG
jgi:hypothetical protein